jgi:hypothetical protein
VCQQAVITDPDAPASRYPPARKSHCQIYPAKAEESPDSHRVKSDNEEDRVPVDLVFMRRCKFDYVLQNNFPRGIKIFSYKDLPLPD